MLAHCFLDPPSGTMVSDIWIKIQNMHLKKITLENVVCKISAILFRPQYMNPSGAEAEIFIWSQCHGCWCHGSLHHQIISSHVIDCLRYFLCKFDIWNAIGQDIFVIHTEYHSCWWLVVVRSQGISSHGINIVLLEHDDIIKWKHFLRYWPFVWGIHQSPVNSPHKGQWRGDLMLTLICAGHGHFSLMNVCRWEIKFLYRKCLTVGGTLTCTRSSAAILLTVLDKTVFLFQEKRLPALSGCREIIENTKHDFMVYIYIYI